MNEDACSVRGAAPLGEGEDEAQQAHDQKPQCAVGRPDDANCEDCGNHQPCKNRKKEIHGGDVSQAVGRIKQSNNAVILLDATDWSAGLRHGRFGGARAVPEAGAPMDQFSIR